MSAEQILLDAIDVWKQFMNFEITFFGYTFSYGEILIGLFLLSVGCWFLVSVFD